ncbi:MAG: substrate-binding domain-containing protein, partial [Trebonia sp.]
GPFAPRFEAGVQGADLALAASVTAILVYNDLMAVGTLTRLADRGVAVPEQMSVVGFDDIAMAAMSVPPLTTVAMPKERAGRAAVDLLMRVLDTHEGSGNSGKTEWQDLPAQLIVRSSTALPSDNDARSSRPREKR